MIRDLITGAVAGFFAGLFIASQCAKNSAPATISKIDTLVISVIRYDTIITINKGQQSVIIKDCKYAEIKQDIWQNTTIAQNDSLTMQQTSSLSPSLSPSSSSFSPRFGIGVGLYSQWNKPKPVLGYSLLYTITEPLKIEATIIPTYRLIGVKAVATF